MLAGMSRDAVPVFDAVEAGSRAPVTMIVALASASLSSFADAGFVDAANRSAGRTNPNAVCTGCLYKFDRACIAEPLR